MWRSILLTSATILVGALPAVALTLAPQPDQPVVAFTVRQGAALALLAERPDAELLWTSGAGHVAVMRSGDPAFIAGLYRAGAILVLAAGPISGCLSPNSNPAAFSGATKS